MKTKYLLLLLPAIVFLTGCQRHHSVSIPAPDLPARNVSQERMVQSLEGDLKKQEQLQAKIEERVKAIHDSNDALEKLFDRMTVNQERADVLLATCEAINNAIDITVDNIANLKTTGFKKQRVHIQDGRIVETPRVWRQGNFHPTANPLDLVIDGEGFFQILQPNGDIAYTRDGSLHLNRYGNIVTANGDMLNPQITVPEDQIGISVGSDGSVLVEANGQSQPQIIGRIELVRFQNPSGLKAIGRNLFVAMPASGEPVAARPGYSGLGGILQGFLEDSNVNMVEELMQLHILQSWKKGVDQALKSIYE